VKIPEPLPLIPVPDFHPSTGKEYLAPSFSGHVGSPPPPLHPKFPPKPGYEDTDSTVIKPKGAT